MSWNYRVTKNANGFALREVYYDKDEIRETLDIDKSVWGYTDPINGYWETREELISALQHMAHEATLRETLEVDDDVWLVKKSN